MLNFCSYKLCFAIGIIVAYLIGNISPAILIARAKGIDIKKEGSGNAGTTNVLRVLGKKWAVATLVIDVMKGVVAVILGWFLGGKVLAAYCIIAVVAGHIWPIFFNFKGGKGVATCFGGLLAYNYILAFSALGVVALGILMTKRMSFGAVLAAACFPLMAFFLDKEFLWEGVVLGLIVIYKHKSNIKRLLRGEEPKIGEKNGSKA